jgi:syntaxin 1B/2/3
MAPLAQNGSQFGRQADPNQILNACGEINQGIKEIKRLLEQIQSVQGAALNDPNGTRDGQVEEKASEILAMYRELTGRVKSIKQMPESGTPRNAQQVGMVDRALKKTYQDYLQIDRQFRQRSNEQSARQYRIVRPDASEEEVREAVENPDSQQVFQQAMMNSNRRGQAQTTMNAVRLRHEAIQNIERQMIELAELFTDMDNLVMQQEAAVTNIEMKGEEVVEHMDKGNQEIGTAIVHARNTRKWKWWCLCITGMSPSPLYLFLANNHSPHHSNHRRRRRRLVLYARPRRPQEHQALRHHRPPLSPRALRQPVVSSLYGRKARPPRRGLGPG